MPDDATYQRYIAPHESKLIAAAWRVLGNENDVGDAIQDALTRIWKNRKTLETHPNPTAWMLRIVLNAAYDQLRKRKVQRTKTLPLGLIADDTSAESKAQAEELKRRLLEEISSLSPKQAQAILLRLVEEMPYAEISEAMGCSEATARVHVKRGRENLQERLADLQPTSQGSHS
ncbi:MAG: RNA polymerase sigma factor [Pirellulales bacterium]|jgi:RNA polymerase sigma-70 factor (ECF subfamily)